MKYNEIHSLASYISGIPKETITDKQCIVSFCPILNDSIDTFSSEEIEKYISILFAKIYTILVENPYLEQVLKQAPVEVILSVLSKYNIYSYIENIIKNTDNLTPDILIQNRQAQVGGVPQSYNATVGMFLGENGEVIISPNIKTSLEQYSYSPDTVKYHHGEGKEIFRKSLQHLIKEEEKRYGWINDDTKNRKGIVLEPFFIPGGVGGLTLARDYFLTEGDLAIVPNKRWPNIDGILSQATKVPVAVSEIYIQDGKIDFGNLEKILKTAEKQGRKKVLLYLNPVCNPTGTTFSTNDSKKLNILLNTYYKISITLVIDDPYGAFARNAEGKVIVPLSYFIDTDTNVTTLEMGSRGTKEGGIYGLRLASMSVFTSQENSQNLENIIKNGIRQTFSMSPSFPQDIYVQALFGESDMEKIKELDQEEKSERIQNYLDGREEMIEEVQKRRESLSKIIAEHCSEYLEEIQNISEGKTHTGGFFIGYNLSEKLLSKGITAEEIRKSCISLGKEGCAITVVNNIIRIVLIPEKYHKEFSQRLKKALDFFFRT